MNKRILMFPGIGYTFSQSQLENLAKTACIQELRDEATTILGYDPWVYWEETPECSSDHRLAEQIINLLVSLGYYRQIIVRNTQFNSVIGHSCGLYTALVVAKALTLSQALFLIQKAHRAIITVSGGMLSVFGYSEQEIITIIANHGLENDVWLAVQNNNLQHILAGTVEGLNRLNQYFNINSTFGGKYLSISNPIHCPLLKPVISDFIESIDLMDINPPEVAIFEPVQLKFITDESEVRAALNVLLVGQIRWYESVLFLISQGYFNFIEVGASNNLSKITRWISRELVIEGIH